MIYQFVEKNGIKMIELSVINNTGLAEGFCTTRHGGISTGTYASMNCNIYKKLDLENGQENYRLFCKAIGVDPNKVITNRLNAGTNLVRCVTKSDLIDIYDEPNAPRADGIVTNDPEITLYFYAADCAIIQIFDPIQKAIGACHAGWKGSLIGIIPNTIQAMKKEFGSNPQDLVAVICPSIASCCFEVGDEVAEEFRSQGFEKYIFMNYPKPHIDLFGVNSELLLQSGLEKERIHKIELCTYCHEDLFHSYRRGPVENGVHKNGMNGMFLRLVR